MHSPMIRSPLRMGTTTETVGAGTPGKLGRGCAQRLMVRHGRGSVRGRVEVALVQVGDLRGALLLGAGEELLDGDAVGVAGRALGEAAAGRLDVADRLGQGAFAADGLLGSDPLA